MPPPTPAPHRTVIHAPSPEKECIEKVGIADYSLQHTELIGGSCGVRLNECDGFYLADLAIHGMSNPLKPDGTPGDDGHGIQVINCGGTIHYCWLYADPLLAAEDLISIYGDKPATESKVVIVELCHTYYRSKSPTCTHICIDGPHPPKVRIVQNRGMNPRCNIMVAGGKGHYIVLNGSYGADTDCYVTDYYHTRKMGNTTIMQNAFPKGILLDTPPNAGNNNTFQT